LSWIGWARRCSVSPRADPIRFLDFQTAAEAVERVRARTPDLGPPVPLHECDRARIESALGVPRVGWPDHGDKYPTLEDKAAALAVHLARSQPCIDGNKRVALIVLTTFLWINGRRLEDTVAESTEPAEAIMHAATSTDEESAVVASLAAWLGRTTRPL
jgi:death on curing protein